MAQPGTEPNQANSLIPEAESGYVPVEELARQQQVEPLRSTDELVVPGMFDSDEELDEFLAGLYAERRAGMPGATSSSTRM